MSIASVVKKYGIISLLYEGDTHLFFELRVALHRQYGDMVSPTRACGGGRGWPSAFLVRVRTNLPAAIIGAAYAGAAHLPVAVRPCTIVVPVARYRARRPRGVCHEHQPPGAPRAGRRTILAPAWACN